MTAAQQLPAIPSRPEVIQLLTGELRNAAENLPPEIAVLTESELYAKMKMTQIDWFLRKNLWNLVETARKTQKTEITQAAIYSGICTNQNFYLLCQNALRVALLLTPINPDMAQCEEILAFGLKRMRDEFMTMPINEKTAGHFLRALEFFMNRVHGPVVQRIEAKHAHLNLNKPMADIPRDITERLSQLQGKIQDVAQSIPQETNDIQVPTDSSGD